MTFPFAIGDYVRDVNDPDDWGQVNTYDEGQGDIHITDSRADTWWSNIAGWERFEPQPEHLQRMAQIRQAPELAAAAEQMHIDAAERQEAARKAAIARLIEMYRRTLELLEAEELAKLEAEV